MHTVIVSTASSWLADTHIPAHPHNSSAYLHWEVNTFSVTGVKLAVGQILPHNWCNH